MLVRYQLNYNNNNTNTNNTIRSGLTMALVYATLDIIYI